MENDILESLNDIGYTGPLTDEAALEKALELGPKSLAYTELVHTLADEIKQLCSLEETVNNISDPEEASSFLLELSSFLKELGCPYPKLTTGHMSSRLQCRADKLLVLDYLLSTLMAGRMVNVEGLNNTKPSMEIVMQETPTAKDLKDILIAMKFNKPPPNITAEVLFKKLEGKLQEIIQKDPDAVGKPLYNKAVSEKQWKELENTFVDMMEEYRLRRETLITRMECTVQSCEWSDRLKDKKEQIQAVYRPIREQLKLKPNVRLSDFLAARTTLLQVEKTSSATVRKHTQSEVNKVIIGKVPDRGGRPNEQQPPPPEMPSWQQRSNQPGGGRGGGGGGFGGQGRGGARGGGGGRVQGGYNSGAGGERPLTNPAQSGPQRKYQTYEVPPGGYRQNNSQGSYDLMKGSGGYNQNSGGYNQNSGGYNQNSGGYNQHSGGYNQNSGGYNPNSGGYGYQNQSYGGGQGASYNNKGYASRGGYQNEHDDRMNGRGRSNYNRGGRR